MAIGTASWIPFDLEPSLEGRWRIEERVKLSPLATYIREPLGPLYVPHFASCPASKARQ